MWSFIMYQRRNLWPWDYSRYINQNPATTMHCHCHDDKTTVWFNVRSLFCKSKQHSSSATGKLIFATPLLGNWAFWKGLQGVERTMLQAQCVAHEVCNGVSFLQSLLLFALPEQVVSLRRAFMHPDVHKLQQLVMSYNSLGALRVPVLVSFL